MSSQNSKTQWRKYVLNCVGLVVVLTIITGFISDYDVVTRVLIISGILLGFYLLILVITYIVMTSRSGNQPNVIAFEDHADESGHGTDIQTEDLLLEKNSKHYQRPDNNTRKTTSTTADDPMKQLEELIGLSGVKNDVKKLADYISVQRLRKELGLKVSPITYHCVFTGNPGTGKTTVARILAAIYRDLGILKKGHLVETDRSRLVGEYVGQTAPKTNKVIDSALDGILFIDEAYSLIQKGSFDYGNEAVATLLKRMEDDRERLVVILAGYDDEMERFLESNPGLRSRFNRYIHFDDYKEDELLKIFKLNISKSDYILSPEAEEAAVSYIRGNLIAKDKNFGNARFARNMFEKTLENQASRITAMNNVTKEDLKAIADEDIPSE